MMAIFALGFLAGAASAFSAVLIVSSVIVAKRADRQMRIYSPPTAPTDGSPPKYRR